MAKNKKYSSLFNYTVVIVSLLMSFGFNAEAKDSLIVRTQRDKLIKETLHYEEMHIRFKVSKDKIEPSYMNNDQALENIVEWVDRVQRDSLVDIVSVVFAGGVSPEGPVKFNRWLSNARMTALEKYVRSRIDIPEELIVRDDHYISWIQLDSLVAQSDWSNKEEILSVIRSGNNSTSSERQDSRIEDLKKLDGGRTWEKLLNTLFLEMRNAYTILTTKKSEIALKYESLPKMESLSLQSIPVDPGYPVFVSAPIPPKHQPAMYVKTNLIGLGMMNANIALEFDLGRYFSLAIPVSYSAMDYFDSQVKFRNLSTQPELRVWPMTNKDKLFIGAHVGFGYYNFAFGGDWRYQDHEGKTPTLGGGLSLGYRLPISKNNRWKLEFSVGAGVYPLKYDVFYNTEDVIDGALFDTREKLYMGIDNVQIGISYRIPFKKSNSNQNYR